MRLASPCASLWQVAVCITRWRPHNCCDKKLYEDEGCEGQSAARDLGGVGGVGEEDRANVGEVIRKTSSMSKGGTRSAEVPKAFFFWS